jgi:tight adherence protein B
VTALLAAVAAGLAAALLSRRRASGPAPTQRRPRRQIDLLRHSRLLAAAAASAVLPAGPLVALAAGVVVAAVVPGLADAASARAAGRERSGWQAALGAFAVSLRAAAPVADALHRGAEAAAEAPALRRTLGQVAASIRLGADPAATLAARFPHGPGAALGAALGLAYDLGAPPAVLATRLAEQSAAETRTEQATAVELSGARATVHLLAALPLAGLGLAAAFGASAPAYLLTTRSGQVCLLAAACFEAAGLTWTRRLLHAAT